MTCSALSLQAFCADAEDMRSDIAATAGRETHALGYDSLYAPLVDVIRDPRWGRGPPHGPRTLGAAGDGQVGSGLRPL